MTINERRPAMNEPHASPAIREERDGRDRLRILLDRDVPPNELAEQTRLVARRPEVQIEQPVALLLMVLGHERLAVEARWTSVVARLSAIRRLPHQQSPLVRGICNVGGRLVIAAHMDRLLGIEREREPGPAARFVVLEDERGPWALEVDRVDGIRVEDAARFIDPPATVSHASARLARAMAPVEGGAVTVLDAPAVLGALAGALT